MKKQINYPSIEQFRNVIANINRQANFVGLDENGEAIINPAAKKPIITFTGTVKLHGTNTGISFNNISGLWAQSRENIITPQKDNAGFAWFVESNKEVLLKLFNEIQQKENIDLNNNTITIYGEWVGKGIQKSVGISNLDKSLFIFGVKVSPFEIEGLEKQLPAYWIDHSYIKATENKIYNINDYPTYSVEIDFNYPQLIQNKLIELTQAVENECPVAREFGYDNTLGEGIVFTGEYNGVIYRFKSKGMKHSVSKVKVLAAVDTDKITSIKEFVEYAVTENRFNQALQNVFLNGEEVNISKIGDVIRWVINDVIKEETDTLIANNLEPKEINKYVSNKVREMFFNLPL